MTYPEVQQSLGVVLCLVQGQLSFARAWSRFWVTASLFHDEEVWLGLMCPAKEKFMSTTKLTLVASWIPLPEWGRFGRDWRMNVGVYRTRYDIPYMNQSIEDPNIASLLLGIFWYVVSKERELCALMTGNPTVGVSM